MSLPSDVSPRGSSHGPYNGLNIVQGYHKKLRSTQIQGKRPRPATTISELSGDVLLEIFDICQNHLSSPRFSVLPGAVWDWHILVHVCQRWRQVVFASPHRLNLRIFCTLGTPVRKNLDIWPNIPIHIEYIPGEPIESIEEDNIITALEHADRVYAVGLQLTRSQLRKLIKVMLVPFPALRHLYLSAYMSNDVPVLPFELFERSAPRLQMIEIIGIPFPALPSLLLSTSDLVVLYLLNIPQTGYISPEAMVTGLATLTRLERLEIGFQSPASRPGHMRLPPATRPVLPALTTFEFRGAREYLEDFVARINAPQLHSISIHYFNQLVDFEVPQLWQFIDHSEDLSQAMRCSVKFQHGSVSFVAGPTTHFPEPESFGDYLRDIVVRIRCEGMDWQVLHISQVLNQISTVLAHMLHLAIYSGSINPKPEDMDDFEWLQLLRPFSSVQTLFVSKKFAGHVCRALEDIPEEMATEVLPALDMLCLEDQPVSSAHKFITVHAESGCPVTTVDTREAFEERLTSYLNQEIR